jgi:hypothetical protein
VEEGALFLSFEQLIVAMAINAAKINAAYLFLDTFMMLMDLNSIQI